MGPRPKGPLRSGYTTGACATAATKAALLALARHETPAEVEIVLPIGTRVTFKLAQCRYSPVEGFAATIKDGGDDPDCTHGAEICSTVAWRTGPGIVLERGVGVGVVTKPGLGLEIGGPAINPVPRRMITGVVQEIAGDRGVRVVISVPRGEELAKRTLNPRLGILGGISILGTTGIVTPYSTRAFEESVGQSIDVAAALGIDHVVLTTGGRSERFAQGLVRLPEEAFVQMGDFCGYALNRAREKKIRKATICAMPGKMAKLAAGVLMTHASGSAVDPVFLARLAEETGAPPEAVTAIRGANTARHAAEIVDRCGLPAFYERLCGEAAAACRRAAADAFDVECILTDFEGKVLGRATSGGGS